MEIKEFLKKNKFKQYRHYSGYTAWSVENLCEVSDEWEKA